MEISDALLIIDMQNGVCYDNKPILNLDKIVAAMNKRIAEYKNQNKLVIFIQHNDDDLVANTKAWQIIPQLDTESGDFFIQKTQADSFWNTKLKKFLKGHDVEKIEICGAQTEYCIDATIKAAHGLGFEISMFKGMSTTWDNDYMSAQDTIHFYENIWDKRYVELAKSAWD